MFRNYAQNMISLSREIEALKAAKIKAAKNLVVTSKNASISLTVTLVGGYYLSNAAQFMVVPKNTTNCLCACTLNSDTVGQDRIMLNFIQPTITRLSADENGILFQIDAAYASAENPPNPWKLNWNLTFTATDDFELIGPNYVNIT